MDKPLDGSSGATSEAEYLGNVIRCIQRYQQAGAQDGPVRTVRALKHALQESFERIESVELAKVACACERALSLGRERVQESVEVLLNNSDGAKAEEYRNILTQQCKMRNRDVAASLAECKAALLEHSRGTSNEARQAREVVSRLCAWDTARKEANQLMAEVRRLQAAAGSAAQESRLTEQRHRRFWRATPAPPCEAVAASDLPGETTVEEALHDAPGELERLRKALKGYEVEFPEVRAVTRLRGTGSGLHLLLREGVLQTRDLEEEYDLLRDYPSHTAGDIDGSSTAADDVLLARFVADGTVKTLHVMSMSAMERVQGQVLTMSSLQHPNVRSVELVFVDKGNVYVQGSHCSHGTVEEWMSAEARSVQQVAEVAAGVLQGLQYLHSQGLSQGDISPSSILIDDEMQPRLCQFTSLRTTAAAAAVVATSADDMLAVGKLARWLVEHTPAPVNGDEDCLMYELQGLADAFCEPTAETRHSCETVLHRLRFLQPAGAHAEVAVRAHVTWQRLGEREWEAMDREDSDRAELGHVEYARAQEAEQVGAAESKGHDDTEASGSEFAVAMNNGRAVLLPSMEMKDADGWRTHVRREVKLEYPFPPQWPGHCHNCMFVRLRDTSYEYELAEAELKRGMRDAKLVKVERVQNWYLWQRYMHQRSVLGADVGEENVNEVWAWHGTSSVDPRKLCSSFDGVDFRNARVGLFGRGSYFATNSAYSNADFAFTSGGLHLGSQLRHMILAKVLCGRMWELRPAPRYWNIVKPAEGFDSVMGGPLRAENKPAITTMAHVVYDLNCVYPGYLVTYCE